MASPTPKAPQELQAQRAQLALLEQDCARLVNPDYTRPFASLDDAVDRLLPYHVFAEQPSQEADLREAEASGGVLGASRKEVWLAHCLSQAIDVQGQVFRLQKALDKAEERLLSRTELPHFMLQSYAAAEEEQLVRAAEAERERKAQEARAAEQARAAAAAQEALRAQLEAQQAALGALPVVVMGMAGPVAGMAVPAGAAAAGGEPSAVAAAQPGAAAQAHPGGTAAPSAAAPGAAAAPAAAAAPDQQQRQQQQPPEPPVQQEVPWSLHPPTAPPAPQPPRPAPPSQPKPAPPPRPLTEAEKQAEKQKKLQMMAQRIKQRR